MRKHKEWLHIIAIVQQKNVKYDRQVFFNPEKQDNSFTKISDEIKLLNKNIDKLRNPILRIANYLDGHQIAPFDEINLVVDKSIQTDLCDALEHKRNDVISREDTIQGRL